MENFIFCAVLDQTFKFIAEHYSWKLLTEELDIVSLNILQYFFRRKLLFAHKCLD